MSEDNRIGDTLLEVKNISLSFGGVKALIDINTEKTQGESKGEENAS